MSQRVDGCVSAKLSPQSQSWQGEKSQRLYVPPSLVDLRSAGDRRRGRPPSWARDKGATYGCEKEPGAPRRRATTPPQGDAGVPARRPRTQSRGVHRGGECLCVRTIDRSKNLLDNKGNAALLALAGRRVESLRSLSRVCAAENDDVGVRGLTHFLFFVSLLSDLR